MLCQTRDGLVLAPAIDVIGSAQPVAQDGIVSPIDNILHLFGRKIELRQGGYPLPAYISALRIEGIETAIRGVFIMERPLSHSGLVKPGVLIRGMVHDRIQHQPHAALMKIGNQFGQLLIAAQVGIHFIEVDCVLLVVTG